MLTVWIKTAGIMLIIVIVCIILSMMWNSLSTFLTSVGKELIYNAF